LAHARKKLAERLARTQGTQEEKFGTYFQYRNALQSELVKDHNTLSMYNEDNNWVRSMHFNPLEPLPTENSRDQLFTEDGFLRTKLKNITDYRVALKDKEDAITNLKKSIAKLEKSTQKIMEIGEK